MDLNPFSSNPTVAQVIVDGLVAQGVTQVWGVVGDALNPITDAIRTTDGIEWVGVRHEEAAAFAASAQAQAKGSLAVCMGTVGPGSIHLLNGLYDAKKSHAPVLAICGQVPLEEVGSDYFQEVDNNALFNDVAVFTGTVTAASQMPHLLEQAVDTALSRRGVAVLTVPGDLGDLELPKGSGAAHFAPAPSPAPAPASQVSEALEAIGGAEKVTLLVGCGAAGARSQVLELAGRLQAPMVLTLKGKAGLEGDNRFQVGQSGLIGNPAAGKAMASCDLLLMLGTDFPYREWYTEDATVVQLELRQEHVGRRHHVDHAMVGDCALTLDTLLANLPARQDSQHLDDCVEAYRKWHEEQRSLIDPTHDEKPLGKVRALLDNPDERIRPEVLADALDRHASLDAIFTSDTGMSTAWLARFVEMRGRRQLFGSYNLGSMANAMPMALGLQALDRNRQVIACCGDGGLMMLLGDLRTAVTEELPVNLVVFDNGRLGMVKLEQEQAGLPEFGTVLDNPDLAAVATSLGLAARRVTDPTELDEAVAWALAQPGPTLLDVVTNPDEIALPPKPTPGQAWGFALAKSKEVIRSAR